MANLLCIMILFLYITPKKSKLSLIHIFACQATLTLLNAWSILNYQKHEEILYGSWLLSQAIY